jgi:hypothetical protein
MGPELQVIRFFQGHRRQMIDKLLIVVAALSGIAAANAAAPVPVSVQELGKLLVDRELRAPAARLWRLARAGFILNFAQNAR